MNQGRISEKDAYVKSLYVSVELMALHNSNISSSITARK